MSESHQYLDKVVEAAEGILSARGEETKAKLKAFAFAIPPNSFPGDDGFSPPAPQAARFIITAVNRLKDTKIPEQFWGPDLQTLKNLVYNAKSLHRPT